MSVKLLLLRYSQFVLACVFAPQLFAHAAVDEQLASTDAKIRQQPNNAELYIHRGRLLLEAGYLEDAEDDFSHALALDGKLQAGHFFLASVYLQANAPQNAEHETLQFIRLANKGDVGSLARGYRQLGHSYWQQGKQREAAEAYRSAIYYATEPAPDQYIECAAAFMALDKSQQLKALVVLDQGLAKLGPLVALQEAAINAELQLGDTHAAISRLDTLVAQVKRPAFWLYRKAQVLAKARRFEEAKHSFSDALEAIGQLRPQQRQLRATAQLKSDIMAALAALPTK